MPGSGGLRGAGPLIHPPSSVRVGPCPAGRLEADAAGMKANRPSSGGDARERAHSLRDRPRSVGLPGRWYAPLLVRRFPQVISVPGLAPVGRSDLQAVTMLRLRPISVGEALRRVREDRAHIEAELSSTRGESDRRTEVLHQEAVSSRQLEEGLVSRRTRLWDVAVGLSGRGRSGPEAERSIRRVKEDLQDQGFRWHDPRWRAFSLLAGLEPGGPLAEGALHALPEEGVAALLPLWEDRLSDPRGVLVGLHARNGTPLFMDRFSHPSHSSLIFGETGSGKTYASALGWIRLRWFYPSLSVMVLDPLGGLAQVVKALGGNVVRVGRDPLGINPLDPATTGGDARAKSARVGVMFRALFPSLTDEESAVLDTALSHLYGRTEDGVPTLSRLRQELERSERTPPRLLTLLSTAIEGSLRDLDRPTTFDLSGSLVGFDLSLVTGDELPFFLTLLLDYAYGEIRRRSGPKLVVLDEAHYLARAPPTARFLDHLVRHVRHFQAGIELLSQNPEDFLAEDPGRSVLMNVDSVLLLRLRDGGEALAPLLGLDAEELRFLRNARLPGNAGYSEGILRTGTLHFPLAIVSSTPEDALLRAAFRTEQVPSAP
jgi:hypothetical protein